MTSEPTPALHEARSNLWRYFPTAVPGETLYGTCARFHHLAGFKRPALTGRLLFDFERAASKRCAPMGLNTFSACVRDAGKPQEIVETMTLGALYLRFMLPERAQRALSWCCYCGAGRERFAFGWGSAQFERQHPLRFCPICMRADEQAIGFAYWHLEHQLPGALVCRTHREPLRAVTSQSSGWRMPELAHTRLCPGVSARQQVFLGHLSSTVVALCDARPIDVQTLRAAICRELEQAGVVRAGGALAMQNVQRWLAGQLQDLAECLAAFDAQNTVAAVCGVLEKRRAPHPLRIALLMTCLVREGASLEDLAAATCKAPHGADCTAPSTPTSPARAYTLLETGMQAKEAAEQAGVSKSVVARWLTDPVLRDRWSTARKRRSFDTHAAAVNKALAQGARNTADLRRDANAAFQWFVRNDPQWMSQQLAQSLMPTQLPLWK